MASAKCRNVRRALLPLVFGTAATAAGLATPGTASATTQAQIAATETQVANLEATIAHEQQQSGLLDVEYLTAQAKVQQIQASLASTRQQLARTQAQVTADRIRLNNDAVYAYVFDAPATELNTLFANSPSRSAARYQYEESVVGNITLDVDALATQEAKLTATTNLEQTQAQQATIALNQVQALAAANQQAAGAAQATLSKVQGTLAVEVAQYAEQQAQIEAAAGAAAAAARNAGVAVALGGPGAAGAVGAANGATGVTVAGSATGSSGGAAAVAAAESQLGVPYVWGGESPGHGFDCSGLTQWSWGRAGVSIPRTAAGQYSATAHVPLNALQPGDLLFYYNLDGDNQIDHVVMYVGSGPYGSQTVIQAPYTGTTVQFSPLFTEGLAAAGRP